MAFKILISDKIEEVCPRIFRDAGFEVDEKAGQSPEELAAIIGNYDGQIVRSATKVTADILEKGKAGKLKIVGRAGAGVDTIDVATADKLGIKVVNTPGLNANAVAELAFGFFIVLSRNLYTAIASIKDGRWEKKGLAGFELGGKTLGLVGFGNIGRKVAIKANGFGMKVLAYDPQLSAAQIKEGGAEATALDEIWSKSDYISLHLPKNAETTNLVNESVLAKFKKTAYLVNCARGGLVDEVALFKALSEKRLAGAAADVFAQEPPGQSPLLSLSNFVAAPHLGASTEEAQLAVADKVARLVIDFLNSKA